MAIATDRDTEFGQGTNDRGPAGDDAVRLSNGGPFAQPADNNNQQNYVSQSEADIGILRPEIAWAIANGAAVKGVCVTPSPNTLPENQGQPDAPAVATPNAAGDSAVHAQTVLQTSELPILCEIANDSNLQNAFDANGVMNRAIEGFQALPTQAANDPSSVAPAEVGLNLSDIGTVFNAAACLADGGINGSNLSHFDTDMHAVADVPKNVINGGGLAATQGNTAAEQALARDDGITLSAARALTGTHAQSMLNHVELQIGKLDGMSSSDPKIDPRSTNDYLLDIIDLAQNDPALAASAGIAAGASSLTGGFAELPGFIMGTIQYYLNDQAQTTVFGLPIHLRYRDMKIGNRTMKSLTITWLR
jgi:hypothetical protein